MVHFSSSFFWTYRCICCCSIRVLWVKPIFENWTVVMPHHCKVRVAVCETNVYVCVGCRYKIVRIKNKEMVGQRRSAGFGAARLQQQSKGPHDAAVKAGSSRYPSIGWALTQTCWSTPARQKSTRTELVRTSTYEYSTRIPTRKATFNTSPRWEKNLCVLTTTVWAQSDIALSLTVETKSSSHIFQLNLIFVVFNPTFNPHLLLPSNFLFFFFSISLSVHTLCFVTVDKAEDEKPAGEWPKADQWRTVLLFALVQQLFASLQCIQFTRTRVFYSLFQLSLGGDIYNKYKCGLLNVCYCVRASAVSGRSRVSCQLGCR